MRLGATATKILLLLAAAFGEGDCMAMQLQSPSFQQMGAIPALYTCEGRDVSPPLVWSDPPEGTVTFVLIVDDPDAPDPKAPKMTWVHWILYNIPGTTRTLAEAVSPNQLPKGTLMGTNDFRRTAYGGPCPPIGRHRYFFKLYALSRQITGLTHPSKQELEQAMEGAILAKAELIGTYEKQQLH